MSHTFLDLIRFAERAIGSCRSMGEVKDLHKKARLIDEAISWLVLAKRLNQERLERLGPDYK